MEKDVSKASNYINNVKAELAKVRFPVKAQIKTAYISVFSGVTV